MKQYRVLTWHVHGSYLNYLVEAPHRFYLPVKPGLPEGYGGKGATFEWPGNVYEVPAERVKDLELDLVLYQSPRNYLIDRLEILSEAQQRLPSVYLEHNTPREHPTDTRHPVDDPDMLMVHCTYFNRMMWDSGRCQTAVVPHGVKVDGVTYQGDLAKGVVVVNEIERRGRIAGFDVWQQVRQQIPLDLIGMKSEHLGGLGDIPHRQMLERESHYRFFFNPIRYTSLPLALLEAMAVGLPIVALATTEIPTVVRDGREGFVSNDLDYLTKGMQRLLADAEQAQWMGNNARKVAEQRFGIERFVRDWSEVFRRAIEHTPQI